MSFKDVRFYDGSPLGREDALLVSSLLSLALLSWPTTDRTTCEAGKLGEKRTRRQRVKVKTRKTTSCLPGKVSDFGSDFRLGKLNGELTRCGSDLLLDQGG